MNRFLKIAGIVIALCFAIASYILNTMSGIDIPKVSPDEAQLYGLTGYQWFYVLLGVIAVSTALVGGLFIKRAWQTRNIFLFLVSLVLVGAAEVHTVRMELRFAAMTQSEGIATRKKALAQGQSRKDQIKAIDTKLEALGEYGSSLIVKAKIAEIEGKVIGKGRNRGKTIREATRNFTKDMWFTTKYKPIILKLRKELAIAEIGEGLDAQKQNLLNQQKDAPAIMEASPEAAWLARLLPITEDGAIDYMLITILLIMFIGRTCALPLAFMDGDDPEGGKAPVPDASMDDNKPETPKALETKIKLGRNNIIEFDAYKRAIKLFVEHDTEMQFAAHMIAEMPGRYDFPAIFREYKKFCTDAGVTLVSERRLGSRLKDMNIYHGYYSGGRRMYEFGRWASDNEKEDKQIGMNLAA